MKRLFVAVVLLLVMVRSAFATNFTSPDQLYGWNGTAQFWQTYANHLTQLTADLPFLKTAGGAMTGTLALGVASTTTGLVNFYNSSKAYPFGLYGLGADSPGIGWRLPSTLPAGTYLVTVDTNGYMAYLDPSTLGGDNLGSATSADVIALWGTCSGYLKSDGTCSTPSGTGAWGGITGTLTDQTDLATALAAKAPLSNPTFTGTVTFGGGVVTISSSGIVSDRGDTYRGVTLIENTAATNVTNQSLHYTNNVLYWRTEAGADTAVVLANQAGSVFQAYDADLTTWASITPGTGVGGALANPVSTAGGVPVLVANGTSALGTSAIASGACATVVTTAATGVATTDVIDWGFNDDPTSTTGYNPSTGVLTVFAYPSANNVNFKVCNLTGSSITPSAVTLNWRVAR